MGPSGSTTHVFNTGYSWNCTSGRLQGPVKHILGGLKPLGIWTLEAGCPVNLGIQFEHQLGARGTSSGLAWWGNPYPSGWGRESTDRADYILI